MVSRVHAARPGVALAAQPQLAAAAAHRGLELDPGLGDAVGLGRRLGGAEPAGGRCASRHPRSRSATPSRPSTVVRFQVKETRSRQKQSVANRPAARSTSRAVRASSKSASQRSTRCWAAAALVSALVSALVCGRGRRRSASWASSCPGPAVPVTCDPPHTRRRSAARVAGGCNPVRRTAPRQSGRTTLAGVTQTDERWVRVGDFGAIRAGTNLPTLRPRAGADARRRDRRRPVGAAAAPPGGPLLVAGHAGRAWTRTHRSHARAAADGPGADRRRRPRRSRW